MPVPISRRRFLASAAALAAAPAVRARGANEKLNIALIGAGGRGAENLAGLKGENLVALCDVDPNYCAAARTAYPAAEFFTDYRKLFDKLSNKIDAVLISTPDHSHAHPTITALTLNKHVYCEKPLAFTVNEVRAVRMVAAGRKLATQMGTQIHAGENYRRVVEIVRGGGLGAINRVHVWFSGGPTPMTRRDGKPDVKFDTDLWQGTSVVPLFATGYASGTPKYPWPHFDWRYWWEFGGGTLADFGCHFMDLPFWALNLTAPTTVAAEGKTAHAGQNAVPGVLKVDYQFPEEGTRPAVHLTWQHGVRGPEGNPADGFHGFKSGVLCVGEKGQLVADYSRHKVLPDDFAATFKKPDPNIPKSVGHHREWIEAVKTGSPTTCPFEYGGRLSEAVLLGNVAYRAKAELAWNENAGTVTNAPAAAAFLGREYRKGWELPKA